MRAGFLHQREEHWLRQGLLAPLAPMGWLYGGAATLHRVLYRRGVLTPRRLATRVVSVGNLVAGGTGKTPLAAWLADALSRRGHRVVLASRGYGRQAAAPIGVVSDGVRMGPAFHRLGDEPVLLAAHAPGVPVVVGRDRGLVGLRALSAFDADMLVLDDGFHHHRLARDLDLVCFDGGFGFGNRAVLPRGPLREPQRALRHADAVAVVDGPLPPEDEALLGAMIPTARRLRARRQPFSLRALRGGGELPLEKLHGLEVGMLAATGLPAAFRRTLESLGAKVGPEQLFPDHHRYRPQDLAGLAKRDPVWVTTEKDALKIVPWWPRGAEVWVLRIRLEVEEGPAFLDWLEAGLARASGSSSG
jgi:tetraacyldisaccharide 4'-kinase